jgi:Heterokaryon incompatibility protein (HET)
VISNNHFHFDYQLRLPITYLILVTAIQTEIIMRLLHTATLQLEEFNSSNKPPYAILSHIWTGEEISFDEMLCPAPETQHKAGFSKIKGFCDMAKAHGLSYAWVDSCCIDKRSSAELTEAINSMYMWYRDAIICIVYLVDVSPILPDVDEITMGSDRQIEAFKKSRWFTRGWTLQELVASSTRLFFANDWSAIFFSPNVSPIDNVNNLIAQVTGIRPDVLQDSKMLSGLCIAERMSWQAKRQTTREEDIAYSLMGIFSVSMPILYGEGAYKAFRRLQEEIIKSSFDHTIFAWPCPFATSGLLARSPKSFANIPTLNIWKASILAPFQMTNAGLRLQLMIIHNEPPLIPGIIFAILACDAKTEYGWGNILVRLKALDDVGCYVDNRRCRAFRRVGSTGLDFSPFNAFKVTYEDVVVFEDEQFELAQTAAQHHQITWSEVKTEGRLDKVLLSVAHPKNVCKIAIPSLEISAITK